MASGRDPQDRIPEGSPDLRSLTVSSPVVLSQEQAGLSAALDSLPEHSAPRAGSSFLRADSSTSHRHRGSNQSIAADTSQDVTGAQRSVLATLFRECEELVARSLSVQVDEVQSAGKPAAVYVKEMCSKLGAAIHAVSFGEAGDVVVTFIDARDCQRAKAALSRAIGTIGNVRDARAEEPEHIVTGLVLAVKHMDQEEDEIVVEDMKRMLSIFGAVVSGQQVTVPSTPQAQQLAVFEFFSILDAARAVEAIGNRSGSSFSLFLINRDGSPACMPPSALQLGDREEGSQLSSFSDRTGSASVPLVSEDAQRAALLAAVHIHAQTSPPPSSGPPVAPPSAPMPPAASLHEWSALPGMPMQPPGRRPADFLTTFDPNEAAAGGVRARTTIMIRNIPCRWTADDLLSVLSHIIGGTWDLLYMPCKNTAVANAGYAFMNFCTPQDTLRLYNSMHGRQWPHTRSGKICEIRYARIQGRQLLTHLNSIDPSGAAAFRGYLAYPSSGTIVMHGPSNAQPALPMHPGMHALMPGIQGAQQAMDASQYALRGMSPGVAFAQSMPANMAPRPPGVQYMPGMVPSGGGNTAVSEHSVQPQELEGYNDLSAGSWPVQAAAYASAVPAPQYASMEQAQYAMQMQPMGVAVPATCGMETSGSSAYQLQCMLQNLMHSMPPPQ